MDLTSGFYNVPHHESNKRYTLFTTPLGLYEYRVPQHLCNSPASFMQMMLSIFGDLNFSSLLCFLDNLLVFAPSEEEALKQLEVVFSLDVQQSKACTKKCNFLRCSVMFMDHEVDAGGVLVNHDKVRVIFSFQKEDLINADECMPSQRKVRSFPGMVMFYQHFIPECSLSAKSLFALTAGQKKRIKGCHGHGEAGSVRELTL